MLGSFRVGGQLAIILKEPLERRSFLPGPASAGEALCNGHSV